MNNFLLLVYLFYSASFIVTQSVVGDAVDDAMVADIATYNVRGAGIAVFDSVSVRVQNECKKEHSPSHNMHDTSI